MLERGLEEGALRALRFLAEQGEYARAVSTFPSVTPVCLTSIATGVHPDVHHIPHLVWYHRGEQRLVEYGSSFPAMRAVGARQCVRDTIFNMTHAHLGPRATTVFEVLDDEGIVTAAINFTCYRGRTRHPIKLPGLASRNRWYEAAYGPRRFFFFNLFESEVTGAQLAIRSRLDGSTDAYASSIGRWLVTRDGFDFLVVYLPDYDYASHLVGPESALDALARADAGLARVMEAAGGFAEFLERYAIVVCSDHGQTHVEEAVRLEDSLADLEIYRGRRSGDPDRFDVAVTASNRSGMIYRLREATPESRALAQRVEGEEAVDVVLFRESGEVVARREGEELRFAPVAGGWRTEGDPDVLDADEYPHGMERAWRALACPNAGEVIVSASEGYEFTDLGGRSHVPGGSHGSLVAADSTVPLIAAGFDAGKLGAVSEITDLAPLALAHFGIDPPASMRPLEKAGV